MAHKPYIPQDIGELWDHMAHMRLYSPNFEDDTGYLPGRNIDTEFFSLNEGLKVVRKELGEERYALLRAMSDKMRALFESDPEDKNGNTRAGRMITHEMDDILESAMREAKPAED